MADPVDALITFFESWQQDGVGKDGLPLFREVLMIRKAKPPLLEVTGEATAEDIEAFPEPYRLFEKKRGARTAKVEGYPLSMWPVVSPAELAMCAARDILTVEQLAGLGKRDDIPPQLRELGARAKKMIELQGKVGKFEVIINELTAQRDVLAEQLREANQTISAQNALIGQMRSNMAPVLPPEPRAA